MRGIVQEAAPAGGTHAGAAMPGVSLMDAPQANALPAGARAAAIWPVAPRSGVSFKAKALIALSCLFFVLAVAAIALLLRLALEQKREIEVLTQDLEEKSKDYVSLSAACEKLKSERAALESENAELESQVSVLRAQNDNYSQIAADFRRICGFFSSGGAGFASASFKASESVICMSVNDLWKPFTLTTDFGKSATISVQYEGVSATAEFTEERWGSSTTVNVYPSRKGTTVATYTNNLNDQKFSVLIIVLDQDEDV
jgi:cell division protein FtsB